MEDMYIKPGNQERGWNDPPQFSYGLQKAHGPQRSLLNKRAAPPEATGTGAPPMTPPSSSPLAPPPTGLAPPPLTPARHPPGRVATPPPTVGPMSSQREADSSQSESEPDMEDVMSVLNRALAACRQTVKDQVCSDVEKRLRLLEDSWRTGRLSLPVRRRMLTLSLELQVGHWDSADEVHRSLMVDHVTEVIQWMVGVKRLIAETRKLSPELLKPLQKPSGPAQDSAGPAQDSAGPAQDSAGPAQDSSGPAQDSAGPARDSAEPVQDPAAPVQDPEEPVQDPAEPAQDC
ncbi:steroid receptor RNA activator 1-like [Plectropomus leopardus]|uniref:steroid receptor RNA activator 1-like n=1 Tax=Plectropomus leopardus TaxID=160734 RepID=UPI001C4D3AFF|nr:steroid receptor RNA activator 1-like [Plectropomus leopardus]XP_042355190.1 steroid receptor RNA activator 1-like [Plectropomus leopardus]